MFKIQVLLLALKVLLSTGGEQQDAPNVGFQQKGDQLRVETAVEKGYFGSPVDKEIILSGTFGELRGNHFHSGIDIKTEGRVGQNILASADGFVSRIKISPTGYGKALYIKHPNGLSTVYAHLQRFVPILNEYVREHQYRNKSFELDLQVPDSTFVFKKGDLIAYSGNSGNSAAPHLHFEIRDSDTDEPMNPLLWGFDVEDRRRPVVTEVRVKTLDQGGNARSPRTSFKLRPLVDGYRLNPDTVVLNGAKAACTVHCYDLFEAANNKNGIYSIQLFVDGLPHYSFNMDRFSFDETAYINSHIDYGALKTRKKTFHKCYVEPGNELSIYNREDGNGIIDLSDGKYHRVEIKLKDLSSNVSYLKFVVKYKPDSEEDFVPPYSNPVYYGMPFEFSNEEIQLFFPPNCFYTDLDFNYERTNTFKRGVLSTQHKILSELIPIHNPYQLSIKTDKVPDHLKDKAIVVFENESGEKKAVNNCVWEGDWLECEPDFLGSAYISYDNEPPSVKPVKRYRNRRLKSGNKIQFKIEDKLSGIKNYSAKINDSWVLPDFDKKSGTLSFRLHGGLESGRHRFDLQVEDQVGNSREYSFNFKI